MRKSYIRLSNVVLYVFTISILLLTLLPLSLHIEKHSIIYPWSIAGETPLNTSVILWITPWGRFYNPSTFPIRFIPGIVIAYDMDCGLCTSSLQQWLSMSMYFLRELYNLNRTVFINLFCEEYEPSYIWRGTLTNVTKPPSQIIEKLKNVIGSGQNVYIGFSELTACVNNDVCLSKLIDIYSYLRNIFPDAKLYYYGGGGDSIDKLVELYQKANLDLIGIDIWELSYNNGIVTLSSNLLNKLNQIAKRVGWNNVILGEIGLRVNDEEAYIEPWNGNRKIKYNPNITSIYYRHILSDLVNKSVTPAYIGIWAWNDNVFAIDNRIDILSAIEESVYGVTTTTTIIPSPSPTTTTITVIYTVTSPTTIYTTTTIPTTITTTITQPTTIVSTITTTITSKVVEVSTTTKTTTTTITQGLEQITLYRVLITIFIITTIISTLLYLYTRYRHRT